MARPTSWKDLVPGLIASLVVIGAAAAILVFGSVGRLHGKTVTIYVTSDGARGIITGSEVWLDGQKIGLVRSIAFRPPSTNPRERLVIELAVLKDAASKLRVDSHVEIRPGANLIGDQVVYLSSGTAKTRGVAPGDTIHGGEQTDIEQMTSDVAIASKEFPGIIENVKLLAAQLQATEGTLGAFGIEKGGPGLSAARVKTSRLMARITSGEGTLGRGMNAVGDVKARAARAMAQVDSIRTLVSSDKFSLGRFRRDTTLSSSLAAVRGDLADVVRLSENPNGPVGRARTDTVIVRNLHRSLVAIDSLIADMKKHPLRYIAF